MPDNSCLSDTRCIDIATRRLAPPRHSHNPQPMTTTRIECPHCTTHVPIDAISLAVAASDKQVQPGELLVETTVECPKCGTESQGSSYLYVDVQPTDDTDAGHTTHNN